ncbi:hypothetical protein QQF64_016458 [Cirrhinus molitorella]|uniref:Uncharacterized protein n=1 Tax=Cirrhinus molitorella TaxID=172907 RepID=A0ABR3LR46_9TELE
MSSRIKCTDHVHICYLSSSDVLLFTSSLQDWLASACTVTNPIICMWPACANQIHRSCLPRPPPANRQPPQPALCWLRSRDLPQPIGGLPLMGDITN